MESAQTVLDERRVIFTAGNESFTIRDVVDSANFRGEIEPVWNELLRLVAAENKADEAGLEMDESAIDALAESFRYQHDLITAEETERWLTERGLTLNDFSDHFVRHYWGERIEDAQPESIEFAAAPNELRESLLVELILSDELGRMAGRLSWRIAENRGGAKIAIDPELISSEEKRFLQNRGIDRSQLSKWLGAIGRDSAWFRDALQMEARYRQKLELLLHQKAREREVASLRLPLTKFDLETMELDSLDAAREALLCVRDDGMTMGEVADEGRYPYRHAEILLEDLPEDLQQKFLSVSAGDILEPISRGDGFHLCRVIDKAEPNTDDEAVRERADRRILERYFSELTAKHVQWPTFQSSGG